MKVIIITLISFLLLQKAACQHWDQRQLNLAGTARDIDYLAQEEKDAVMYINLARLFPKLFVKYELINYKGSGDDDFVRRPAYKRSLINKLNTMKPVNALNFDSTLYDAAHCLADESAENNTLTHKRINCYDVPFKSSESECIAAGVVTGKDIALCWLIDNNIANLGHRKICLSSVYKNIGLSTSANSKMAFTVADFNDADE